MDRTPPIQHHAGSKGTVPEGSEVDLDAVINANPCAQLYLTLENCLVETNRSWQKCQAEVKALKDCSQRAASK